MNKILMTTALATGLALGTAANAQDALCMATIASVKLFIDELGFVPLSKAGAELCSS